MANGDLEKKKNNQEETPKACSFQEGVDYTIHYGKNGAVSMIAKSERCRRGFIEMTEALYNIYFGGKPIDNLYSL